MILTIIATILILDGLLFVAKREVLERRVRAVFPRLNCGALAAVEIITGLVCLMATTW